MASEANKPCLMCGRPATTRRAHATFCSAACRQAAYRERLAAEAEAAERARERHQKAIDLAHSLIG